MHISIYAEPVKIDYIKYFKEFKHEWNKKHKHRKKKWTYRIGAVYPILKSQSKREGYDRTTSPLVVIGRKSPYHLRIVGTCLCCGNPLITINTLNRKIFLLFCFQIKLLKKPRWKIWRNNMKIHDLFPYRFSEEICCKHNLKGATCERGENRDGNCKGRLVGRRREMVSFYTGGDFVYCFLETIRLMLAILFLPQFKVTKLENFKKWSLKRRRRRLKDTILFELLHYLVNFFTKFYLLFS